MEIGRTAMRIQKFVTLIQKYRIGCTCHLFDTIGILLLQQLLLTLVDNIMRHLVVAMGWHNP
jgi:hypothetical protein